MNTDHILLEARALSAGYRKRIIVDDISFTLHAGEVLTLIGPNGAGKSTVLKTIANQIDLISGDAVICGKSVQDQTEKELARQISVLLTDRITAERMSCFDVAAAGRYPYTGLLGMLSDQDKQIVQDALKMVGADDLADASFSRISDGQRQSVMLARAIAQEPKVLLLDEPTSYLDISRKLDFLCLLRKLARERGIAVIQSLHELDLAQRFSDKLLCIRDGRAQRFGTPDIIFSGDYITELYSIRNGRYDPLYGTSEPSAYTGQPQVFVIGGGGTAIPVYRKLYRAGIPFATGVIHENDLDYPAAKALAADLITAPSFEPIPDEAFRSACEIMMQCETVICTLEAFGTMNHANQKLRNLAEQINKLQTDIKKQPS